MTKDEALRLALEALEYLATQIKPDYEHSKAIAAIKATLEANKFNPDWDTQAVLVEEIQRMAKRIEELEAQRKPLTDEEINNLDKWLEQAPYWRVLKLARAIEAAHGITGENT